ncbi:MAG: hypothetical protein JWM89_995 [Acidimicrobiales bacterium]|nr:hypothetical protein [Acidimicrobiales bacterium]
MNGGDHRPPRPSHLRAPSWFDELALVADGPPWLAMGLTRIPDAAWLLPDERRPQELAERGRLLDDRHAEVFAALPETVAAGAEVLETVRAWESRHRPDLAAEAVADTPHPLEAAGRRTQEDLVVMVPREGGHHLDAAVLCFPSHWRLADKLGGSATAIHDPVPRYGDELEARVDRFLGRLRPGVLVARRNWSIHDEPDLFAPERPAAGSLAAVGPPDAPDLWLRSERQTLRLLPRTGAVLFTIRVQQAPFAALATTPAIAGALADRLAAQPEALTEMNGLGGRSEPVVGWLRSVAGAGTRDGGDAPIP